MIRLEFLITYMLTIYVNTSMNVSPIHNRLLGLGILQYFMRVLETRSGGDLYLGSSSSWDEKYFVQTFITINFISTIQQFILIAFKIPCDG